MFDPSSHQSIQLAAQRPESSGDDDANVDPRITEGWDKLNDVTTILKANDRFMKEEDKEMILQSLVKLIEDGEDIERLTQAPDSQGVDTPSIWQRFRFTLFLAKPDPEVEHKIAVFHRECRRLKKDAQRSSTKVYATQRTEERSPLSAAGESEFGDSYIVPDMSASAPKTPTQQSFQRDARIEANLLSLPARVINRTADELTIVISMKSPQLEAERTRDPGVNEMSLDEDPIICVKVPISATAKAQMS